ncbi:helix-turn-helix domain-containing protein [Bifidobacterium oedipodis]|uniref:XRE family transcriptional regulator n=1 Tax=Bifidobacterium oedipodis TaxID=2675322 RepID=A0A7Y0EQE9_9BIFI|nr:helix-turn-helix transcriptional regulator [Bifidobacterium sp. DSM 109957]NMM93431.1 XRE family transcriptional regulator [Bifidobacterium sp. DSM 109957]
MPRNTPIDEPWSAYIKEVGLNLQRLRISKGLSQERTAYDAGLSRYTYQKFEKGESMPGTPANPSLHNIMAIAQVLEADLEEILPRPWPDLHAR